LLLNQTQILEQKREQWKVAVKAPAESNIANIDLIKFLSKYLKRKVKIKSGLKSRLRTIEIGGRKQIERFL
jgi:uncharacterized protein (TIGR00251 family)